MLRRGHCAVLALDVMPEGSILCVIRDKGIHGVSIIFSTHTGRNIGGVLLLINHNRPHSSLFDLFSSLDNNHGPTLILKPQIDAAPDPATPMIPNVGERIDLYDVTLCPREDLERTQPLWVYSLIMVGESPGDPKLVERRGATRRVRVGWSEGEWSFFIFEGTVVPVLREGAYDDTAETRKYVDAIGCGSNDFPDA